MYVTRSVKRRPHIKRGKSVVSGGKSRRITYKKKPKTVYSLLSGGRSYRRRRRSKSKMSGGKSYKQKRHMGGKKHKKRKTKSRR